jgi:hypothetical protein
MFWDPTTGSLCLMMPFYQYGQLDEWARDCKPDQITVRRILSQVLDGLAHLHSHQIIHGDIKPSNILVSDQVTARLADFDISVDKATRISTKHVSSVIRGTEGFIAPELSSTGATKETDMFAFGATVKMVAEDSSALVALLCSDEPAQRPTAAATLRHEFFRPVYQWQRDERRRCCVFAYCGGEPVALTNGVECSASAGAHFVCRECFNTLVEKAATEDLRIIKKREGRLLCPECLVGGVSTPFTDPEVAMYASPASFAQYIKSRIDLVEQRINTEFEQQFKERLDAELKRLSTIDEEQRKLSRAYHHICEECLTTKCPRPDCRQAFVDIRVGDCMALSCSRCPCKFCGWCGADCGADAHPHAMRCDKMLGSNGLFASPGDYERAQQRMKREKVASYLATLDPLTAAGVRLKMQKELRELGVD